jgi:hypothetical protein
MTLGRRRWLAGLIGPRVGEGQLGRQQVSAHKARKNRKSFFLFYFFYKLQTILNSN